MKASGITGSIAGLFALAGTALILAGCHGIPAGTTKTAQVGTVQYEASGAGIAKADARKTTIKIKCARCGYEENEMTVDTPSEGKPYTINWVCPKCGNKQTVVVMAKK
ncbi:MAG: hypothetical protein C0404_01620 [Verrucomicrobia bacterium]|nr:hypothetical protein [Verrucomicrobiota bacterium]